MDTTRIKKLLTRTHRLHAFAFDTFDPDSGVGCRARKGWAHLVGSRIDIALLEHDTIFTIDSKFDHAKAPPNLKDGKNLPPPECCFQSLDTGKRIFRCRCIVSTNRSFFNLDISYPDVSITVTIATAKENE